MIRATLFSVVIFLYAIHLTAGASSKLPILPTYGCSDLLAGLTAFLPPYKSTLDADLSRYRSHFSGAPAIRPLAFRVSILRNLGAASKNKFFETQKLTEGLDLRILQAGISRYNPLFYGANSEGLPPDEYVFILQAASKDELKSIEAFLTRLSALPEAAYIKLTGPTELNVLIPEDLDSFDSSARVYQSIINELVSGSTDDSMKSEFSGAHLYSFYASHGIGSRLVIDSQSLSKENRDILKEQLFQNRDQFSVRPILANLSELSRNSRADLQREPPFADFEILAEFKPDYAEAIENFKSELAKIAGPVELVREELNERTGLIELRLLVDLANASQGVENKAWEQLAAISFLEPVRRIFMRSNQSRGGE